MWRFPQIRSTVFGFRVSQDSGYFSEGCRGYRGYTIGGMLAYIGIIGDVKDLGLRDWGLGFRGSQNEGCLLGAPFYNDCGISGSI